MKARHALPLVALLLTGGITTALVMSETSTRNYCDVYECRPCTPGLDCPTETAWMCCPAGHGGGPCPASSPDDCEDILYWCDYGASLPDGSIDCLDGS